MIPDIREVQRSEIMSQVIFHRSSSMEDYQILFFFKSIFSNFYEKIHILKKNWRKKIKKNLMLYISFEQVIRICTTVKIATKILFFLHTGTIWYLVLVILQLKNVAYCV